jgi:hypothetical protein
VWFLRSTRTGSTGSNRPPRSTVVGRVDSIGNIFKRILDDEQFRQTLMELYATRVYERARSVK